METSKTKLQLIRIMISSNPVTSIDCLKLFKQAAQPVVLTQLSSISSGITFFYSYRGSRITTSKQVHFTPDKELLISINEICQKTMGMSVWGDMMDTFEEDNLHCFTQVTLKNYFGKKTDNIKIPVATVHKLTQDFPTLDEIVLKSCRDKDEEIKKDSQP